MSEFCNISHKQQMWHIDRDHVGSVSLTLFEPKEKKGVVVRNCQKVYFNFITQNVFEN